MKKILLLGISLVVINANLFAGIKKEVDMKQFLSELKAIQKQIASNKVPVNNIDNDIQKINKQKQYDFIVGNSKDDEIISKKVKNIISFLNNYSFLLNKKIQRQKNIYGDSYYKIKGVPYLKVNKSNIDFIGNTIYQEKLKILEIKKLVSLLKSFKKIDKRVYLSNQVSLILNDAKNFVNLSNNSFSNRINNGFNGKENKYDFCTLSRKCFGYKVISITPNKIVLDF